uniref:Uncharacterized protein n=1 Tax=Palpitomonas bilix TaxID=652834 RepID=A0A7S3DDF9_9EUKA
MDSALSMAPLDPASFIAVVQNRRMEKCKLVLPHILPMCSRLKVDLLKLSADELGKLLGVDGLEEVIEGAMDVLAVLEGKKKQIQDDTSPPFSRNLGSLAAFLDGIASTKEKHDSAIIAAVPFVLSMPICTCSQWSIKVKTIWKWLESELMEL